MHHGLIECLLRMPSLSWFFRWRFCEWLFHYRCTHHYIKAPRCGRIGSNTFGSIICDTCANEQWRQAYLHSLAMFRQAETSCFDLPHASRSKWTTHICIMLCAKPGILILALNFSWSTRFFSSPSFCNWIECEPYNPRIKIHSSLVRFHLKTIQQKRVAKSTAKNR